MLTMMVAPEPLALATAVAPEPLATSDTVLVAVLSSMNSFFFFVGAMEGLRSSSSLGEAAAASLKASSMECTASFSSLWTVMVLLLPEA